MGSFRNNPLNFSIPCPLSSKDATVILGGGLAGLSTGFVLAKADMPVIVFEGEHSVGGLSRTIIQNDFRFDLGGHRFITKSARIERFVKDLLDRDFLTVSRRSKIYMRSRFFDYPLKPYNAVFGLGILTTLKAISDYGFEKMKNLVIPRVNVSLEDWVVSNFGRTMFNLYFKEYSEKVWGLECDKISKEWVSRRISGLSLWVAIKNAFFRFSGREVETLSDRFIYPPLGIGQVSERLKNGIEEKNSIFTGTKVMQVHHEGCFIKGVTARNCGKLYNTEGREFVSSIPLPKLVQILTPSAPEEILDAASHLQYRDLVVVVIMLNRERVTDLTWMYLPEQKMTLSRIHEPKNWSAKMAPEGKTHIVSEYFCFRGDEIWESSDEELRNTTVSQLERLGFINGKEVIDSCVVRVPKAYPIFEIGYKKHYEKILGYLSTFKNLHICGRGGMFRYYNMDHAVESGIEAAEDIMKKTFSEKKGESQLTGAFT
jgi:protoporphyrinogen oxidase